MTITDTPKLYVGTYAKYNSGSIEGAWLDLDDYADRDDFYEACAELHSDEDDPEFMFQDFENFPREFYCESNAPEALFQWVNLDDDERELVSAYCDAVGADLNDDLDDILSNANDAFMGTADSQTDYAEQYLEDTGTLSEVPENLRFYFDTEAFARDLFMDLSYSEDDSGKIWIFNNF